MTGQGEESDQDRSIRHKLPFRAAALIGMPAVCAARCRRAGQCEFSHRTEGGPFCAQLMTAEEKDLFGRVTALAHHYRTAGSRLSFETGIRQALCGGGEAPLLAAAALSRCFRPGNEADTEVARLRREVRAAEAAARAARRTAHRKARRARRAVAASGETTPPLASPPPDLFAKDQPPEAPRPTPLLPGGEKVPEGRMRGPHETSGVQVSGFPDTAGEPQGHIPETTREPLPRIRPLDRPPLVP